MALHVDDHCTDIDFRTEEKVGGKVYKTMGSELPLPPRTARSTTSSVIRDKCLVKPLPVAALLDAAKADAAVVRGLEAKGDPEIVRIRAEGKTEGKAEGKAEGLRDAIYEVFAVRGLDVSAEVRGAVDACDDLGVLGRWLGRAVVAANAEDVLASRG